MVAVIFLLGTVAVSTTDGTGVPSRRTCDTLGIKPEPKICTPAKSAVEVNVACGTKVLGMRAMTPGRGTGLGTPTAVISAGLIAPRLMASICPGPGEAVAPDSTTKA